jgi:hypothetical protein
VARIKLYPTDHLCETETCSLAAPGRRICWTCIGRIRRNGDPTIVHIHRNAPGFISYGLTHKRIVREKGSAKLHTCACGEQAREWSYDHTDPDQLHSPQGYAYSVKAVHYLPRCWPCHRQFDRRRVTLAA